MRATTLHLIPLLLLLGCGASPATPSGAADAAILTPPGNETVAIGDRVQVGSTGYTLEISALKGDSRCAVDVVCVWEGEFAVTGVLHAAEGMGMPDTPVTLSTHDSTIAAGLTFRITTVTPAPHAGVTIPVADYRMTLEVAPAS